MARTTWRDDAAEDAGWVRQLAEGDDAAMAHLYARYGISSLTHARLVLHDPALAEDAVQEAFLDLWRQAASFDPARCSVGGWIRTLTHRRAVDRARMLERRRTLSMDLLGDLEDLSQDPVGPALLAALSARALEALGRLPGPQQRALVLAYWGGYTMSEIAVLEKAPIGTIKTRCRKALSRLRVELKDEVFLTRPGTCLRTRGSHRKPWDRGRRTRGANIPLRSDTLHGSTHRRGPRRRRLGRHRRAAGDHLPRPSQPPALRRRRVTARHR